MSPQIRSILVNIGAIGIIAGALLAIIYARQSGFGHFPENIVTIDEMYVELPGELRSTASVSATARTSSESAPEGSAIGSANTGIARKTEKTAVAPAQKGKSPTASTTPSETPIEQVDPQNKATVSRIENPYPFPPRPFSQINEETRAALVNIFCAAGKSLKSTSGTGIIIDPRGVILTNAHVAQYILLSGDKRVDLSCAIRSGSPAQSRWIAEILYIPPIWIAEHASEIKLARAMSTGEHDYALLRIVNTTDGSELPENFPYLPVDTREAIGFVDDPVLVASYPAEFLGGIASQFNLFPVSSVTNIKDLLTFEFNTIDVISLGGIIGAQSGSSGGAVANAWGRLIALISTTSEGTTTAQRDLRALTLGYINSDLKKITGADLNEILSSNIELYARFFAENQSPQLMQLLIDNI